MPLTYKIRLGNDVRRITLDNIPNLEQLNGLLSQLFQNNLPSKYQLFYADLGNDLKPITSEKDYSDAIVISQHRGNKVWLTVSEPREEVEKDEKKTGDNVAKDILQVLEAIVIESPQDLQSVIPQFVPQLMENPTIIPELLSSPLVQQYIIPALLQNQWKPIFAQ